jgi:hypothetical protein
MCARTDCRTCGEAMIHRDHRRGYESSSPLGQIVSRDGPRGRSSAADLDLIWREGDLPPDGRTLLRVLEHKQPASEINDGQRRTLRILAAIVNHAVSCALSPIRLDSDSGVFLIRGEVGAETDGHRKTILVGPQRIWKVEGTVGRAVTITRSHREFFDWLSVHAGSGQPGRPAWWPLRNRL